MKNKILALFTLIAILLSSSAAVLATEEVVPVAESSETTTEPAEEPKPEKTQDVVYRFLTEELSLTPAAAAGIMGNIMIECSFVPDKGAMDVNDLYSYGLMMWNGPRYEQLKSWCAEHDLDYKTAIGQLNYLKWELENTEKKAYKTMLDIPNTIEGACKAAILWASDFERCTRTSFGLRIWWTLNTYWPEYAGGTTSDTPGIYGYYYNVPDNIQYGKALTLYGAVVSYSSPLKSITVGVYTEDGELVTGKTLTQSNIAGNIGNLDAYVVFNKIPKGNYYYTITAVNEAGEYTVERHSFTVSDDPTTSTLIKETEGTTGCDYGLNCPSLSFKDVPAPSDWAHDGIDYVLSEGLFQGHPGGIFAPEENMNRAMFVTVICRLGDRFGIFKDEEKPDESDAAEPRADDTENGDTTQPDEALPEEISPETGRFTDVPLNEWYAEYVERAAAAGLVEGMSATTFEPYSPLTRAQLATLMFRFTGKHGACTCVRADLSKFADASDVEDWATDAMSWAVATGLIKGTSVNGTTNLDPNGLATRAQVAAVIKRYIEFIDRTTVTYHLH